MGIKKGYFKLLIDLGNLHSGFLGNLPKTNFGIQK